MCSFLPIITTDSPNRYSKNGLWPVSFTHSAHSWLLSFPALCLLMTASSVSSCCSCWASVASVILFLGSFQQCHIQNSKQDEVGNRHSGWKSPEKGSQLCAALHLGENTLEKSSNAQFPQNEHQLTFKIYLLPFLLFLFPPLLRLPALEMRHTLKENRLQIISGSKGGVLPPDTDPLPAPPWACPLCSGWLAFCCLRSYRDLSANSPELQSRTQRCPSLGREDLKLWPV